MNRMLVAFATAVTLAIALGGTPALAATKPPSLKVQPSVAAWPTICFEFAFWKYCI